MEHLSQCRVLYRGAIPKLLSVGGLDQGRDGLLDGIVSYFRSSLAPHRRPLRSERNITSCNKSDSGHVAGTEVTTRPQYPTRSMEALKSRYYAIAAKMLEMHTPASTMTSTEFQLWEKMRNFDVKTETMRKAMAEKLFERTKDEADEERILLEELHRITKNEDDFIKMRRDLYARLEPVAPIRRGERGEEQSTAMYQTSQGLSMLLQSLLAKEKRLKRPPVPGGAEAGPTASTPADNKTPRKADIVLNTIAATLWTQMLKNLRQVRKEGIYFAACCASADASGRGPVWCLTLPSD